MTFVIGVAGLILLGTLIHFTQRIGDRIAYGPGRKPTTRVDAISAAHFDLKRGDFSGLGGM